MSKYKMNHFYQTIDGFMSHKNTVMLDIVLDSFPAGGCWVELGAWTGKSTAYCVVELLQREKFGKFYCVDTWDGGIELAEQDIIKSKSLQQVFEHNVAPVLDLIVPIKSLSWDGARQFDNDSVDFCYVDAGHTYDCVIQDLHAWWPKIRPGGRFGGDDYTKGHPGVQKAVWEFFGERDLKVRRSGRCWLVDKPDFENINI
jgi:hypothetical protein